MTKDLWNIWISNIEWILQIAKKRSWDYDSLKIKKPIKLKSIEKLENKLSISYPQDFKIILTEFSSGLHMSWQIEGEETTGIYKEIFCGGGDGYLWDFDSLEEFYKGCEEWKSNCFSNPEDNYDKIWYNKVPFLSVPNGDMIAFGEMTEKGNPVIYLSHEDGELHGCKLGDNFVDFITKWTSIGCVGTEDWQFEPFYDFDNSQLKTDGEEIKNWKNWLNK